MRISFFFVYRYCLSAPTKKQLLENRGGVNGQKQPSTPVGLQADTSSAVPLISLEQFVQCEATLALAGVISKAALKIIAAKLPSKSTFYSSFPVLSFCPGQSGRDE